MKYKDQIQTRAEAISNMLETLHRGVESNAISKEEALATIAKLKRTIQDISNFTDLED